jgi:FKBP-type peptidyl-prolyl cis-trans isomerase FklB
MNSGEDKPMRRRVLMELMVPMGLMVVLLPVLAGCSATGPVKKMAAAEVAEVDLTSGQQKLSYAAGYQIGDMFQNQKLSIHSAALLQGIDDARRNIRPVMPKGEMKRILRDPKKFLLEDAAASELKGEVDSGAYLETNSKKAGVVVLESGLQYRVIHPGSGKSPLAQDQVRIKYQGKTLAGNVFTPAEKMETAEVTNVQNLVPGLVEGLQRMQEGGRWELYLPSSLAYARSGPLAGKALIFDIELLEVLPASP